MRGIASLTGTRWPVRRRGIHPYGEHSITDALAALPDEPAPAPAEPSFTARRPVPTRETRPIPVLSAPPVSRARPYVPGSPLDRGTPVELAAAPVIGDSMPVPVPPPAPEAAPVNLLPDCVPYCGTGWAGRLMSTRVRNGEWEDVVLIVERGWGRNAAEVATARRHAREGIAEAARQVCAALGHPEMTDALLRRTQELVMAARAVQAGAR